MNKKNCLIVLFLLFIVMANQNYTPEELDQNSNTPNNATLSPSPGVRSIYMHNEKGTNQMIWECDIQLYSWSTVGMYSSYISYLYDFNYECILYMNGTPDYGIVSPGSSYYFRTIECGLGTDSWSTYTGSTYKYLINNTNHPFQYDLVTADNDYQLYYVISTASDEGTYNGAGVEWDNKIDLFYQLQPVISLNSTYYNLNNIRLETYLPFSPEFGPRPPSDPSPTFEWAWYEQDPNTIILPHPNYKFRIFSKETNELIFEDNQQQNFSAFRTITINSLKVQNNADEPITARFFNSTELIQTTSTPNYILSSLVDTTAPVSTTVTKGINCTLAGQNIQATSPGTTLIGVGKWAIRTSYGPDVATPIASYEGHTQALNLTHKTSGDYGILWYASTATTALSFDIWINTASATAEIRCMFSNGGTGYNVGFYFSAGYIYTPKSDASNLETTGIAVTTGWSQYHVEWTSGGLHKLYRNGTLLQSKTGVTQVNAKTLELGIYQPTAAQVSVYADLVSISDETGYYDYIGWYNGTELAQSVDLDFSALTLSDIKNVSLNYRFQTNVSIPVTALVYNAYAGTNFTMATQTATSYTTYFYNFSTHAQDYFNVSTMALRVWFTSSNTQQNFSFVLGECNATVYYYEIDPSVPTLNVTSYLSNFSLEINPYSYKLTNFTSADYFVMIFDIYGNNIANETCLSAENELVYTPDYVEQCFLSLHDQRATYLNWEQFKIRVNDTLIYSNVFYRAIGTTWNISIYNQYDLYLNSTLHTVVREDNYIAMQIQKLSLKIYNQQDTFIHSKIEYDPNYYSYPFYWSEWLAPKEISEYLLTPDYYRVTITGLENGSSEVYAYTLTDDDTLLITSPNSLTNVLANIQNVNVTLGNQITNVEINITNQNSNINNTIINLNVNLNNINSTLDNMLVNLQTNITAIGNNITNLYMFSQNSFTLLQNNINFSFANINSSIFLMNNSIYTAVSLLSADLTLMNNTVMGNMSIIIQLNEELTDIFINTMFSRYLDWTNASINSTYIQNQVDVYSFLNNYRNQSIELLLKYQNQIETLQIGSQAQLDQMLPNANVTYRVRSVSTGEYLTNWTPITNTTVDLGYYNETIAATPDQIRLEIKDYLLIALFGVVALATISILYVKSQAQLESKGKRKDRTPGVRDTSDIYMTSKDRGTPKPKPNNALWIVICVIVIVFIVVYLIVRFGI